MSSVCVYVQNGSKTFYYLLMPSSPLRLAVFLSGGGRTLQNFIDEIGAGRLNAQVNLVVGSRPELGGIERAAKAKLMNFVVDRRGYEGAEAYSKELFRLCDDAGVDLICLAGWLNLLVVPPQYAGRIMNIHPALLPSFGGKGMFGHKVHQAVLDAGCKVSGCTVHFADAAYDSGPIIVQRTCPVLEDDTAEALADRVFEEEKIAYPQAVRLFQEGRIKIEARRVRILP
jgi:phosphoribosylglycinamide formyltransferase-1